MIFQWGNAATGKACHCSDNTTLANVSLVATSTILVATQLDSVITQTTSIGYYSVLIVLRSFGVLGG